MNNISKQLKQLNKYFKHNFKIIPKRKDNDYMGLHIEKIIKCKKRLIRYSPIKKG